MFRICGNLLPKFTPLKYLPVRYTSTSTQIIKSLEKLATVDVHSQQISSQNISRSYQNITKSTPITSKPTPADSKWTPTDSKTITVRNNLSLLADSSLLSKIVDGDEKHGFSQLDEIGTQVSAIIPLYLRIFGPFQVQHTYEFDSEDFCHLEKELWRLEVRSEVEKVTARQLIGLNWLHDPNKCLKNVFSCFYDVNDRPLSASWDLNSLEMTLSSIKHQPKLNSSYLSYKENNFQLPSIKADSAFISKLLVNGSIVPNSSSARHLLDDFRSLGNLIYKSLVKRALLLQGGQHYLSLYYMFINEAYLQFLLENIPIYNGLLDKTMLSELIKVNSNDLYYRQFGQYFLILFALNPVDTQNWITNHVGNYMDIFNNLSSQELMEFLKDFDIFLNRKFTQIDFHRLKLMDSAAANFKIDSFQEGNVDIQRSHLIALAKDYVSFWSYKFGLVDNFPQMNRQKTLILSVLDKPKHEKLLIGMGKYLVCHSSKQSETLFRQFVTKLTKKSFQIFTYERLRIKKIPTDEDLHPLVSFSLVNYNVSRSFFRSAMPSENSSRLSDTLKKLSLVGYSYYRYSVCAQIIPISGSETGSELQRILLSKVFKTYVMENSHLFDVLGSSYNKQIKSRMVNMYLLLKLGQVGFDQLIGALAIINPEIVDNWIRLLLAHLVEGRMVKVGSNVLDIPGLPLTAKSVTNIQTIGDLKSAEVYLDKLDNLLQLYYKRHV